ncbi:hypothetical protein JCM10908_006516 [Rhodotorula pacifica]|uniref:uncharacterized protein n=1 Tax=Rhodotorula pacifica TaxID=1495444 RepID=UPI00317B0561
MPLLPLLAALAPLVSAGVSSYSLNNLPHTSESGQSGYNDCGTNDSPDSMCQTAFVNSVTDFCLWAPPTPGGTIGDTEQIEVAWCSASGHGARLMPEGTVHSAHYLVTPHYTQITGTGDFTKLNIAAGDSGGELDPHGATGNGNPIGSLVYANGEQIHEWTSISDSEFCFRICHDAPDAWLWCQHIYDIQGCAWNEPGNYGDGFDSCQGDSTEYPPGIYMVDGQLSTYQQSQGAAPTPHAAGASSNCQAVATVGGVAAAYAPAPTTSAAPSSTWSSSAASSTASSTTSSSTVVVSSSTSASPSWTTSTVVSSSVVSSSPSAVSSSTSVAVVTRSAAVVTSSAARSSSTSASSSSTRVAAQPAAAAASTSAHSGAQKLAAAAGASLLAVAAGMAVLA